jgi:hypothetical protein
MSTEEDSIRKAVKGFERALRTHHETLAAIRSLQSTPEKDRERILEAYKRGGVVQWIGTLSPNGWADEEPGRESLSFDKWLYRIKPSSI